MFTSSIWVLAYSFYKEIALPSYFSFVPVFFSQHPLISGLSMSAVKLEQKLPEKPGVFILFTKKMCWSRLCMVMYKMKLV